MLHLIVQTWDACGGFNEHAGHLLGRGEAPQLEDAVLVLLTHERVVLAPAPQQDQQRTLCAIAHQLQITSAGGHEKGLHMKSRATQMPA